MMSSYCEVCQRLFCGPHEHLTDNNSNNNITTLNTNRELLEEQLQCKEQLQTMEAKDDCNAQISYVNAKREQNAKVRKAKHNKWTNIISENNVNEKSPSPWRPKSIPPPLPTVLLEEQKICHVPLLDSCHEKDSSSTEEEQEEEESNNVEESITAVVEKLRHALKKHQVNKATKLTEREQSNILSNVITPHNTEKSLSVNEIHNAQCSDYSNKNETYSTNDTNAKRTIGKSPSTKYEDRLAVKENISPSHEERVRVKNAKGQSKSKVMVPISNTNHNSSDKLTDNSVKAENSENKEKSVTNNNNNDVLRSERHHKENAVLKMLIARQRIFETNMSNEMERLRNAFVELCHAVKEDIDALGSPTSHNTTMQTSNYSEQQQYQHQHQHQHEQRSLSSSPHPYEHEEESSPELLEKRKIQEEAKKNCNRNEINSSSNNNVHSSNQKRSKTRQVESDAVKESENDNFDTVAVNVITVEKPTLLLLLQNANAEELHQIVSMMMPYIINLVTSQRNAPLEEYIGRIAASVCERRDRIQREKEQKEERKETQIAFTSESKEEKKKNVNSGVQEMKIDNSALSKIKEQLKKEIVHEIREECINSINGKSSISKNENVKEVNLLPPKLSSSSSSSLLVPLEPSFNRYTAHDDKIVCDNNKDNHIDANIRVEDVLSAEALEAHVRIAVQSVLLHEAERIKQKEKEEQHSMNAKRQAVNSINVSELREHIKKDIMSDIDVHLKQIINQTITRIEQNVAAQMHNAQHTLTVKLDDYINKANSHYQKKQRQIEQLLSMAHNKSLLSISQSEESTTSRNKMACLLDDRVNVAETAINTLTAQLTSLFYKMEHWQRQEQNNKENKTDKIIKLIESNCESVINKMSQRHEHQESLEIMLSEQWHDKLQLLVAHLVEEQIHRLNKPYSNYKNCLHHDKEMKNNSSIIANGSTEKKGEKEINKALTHDMVCSPSPSTSESSTSPPCHTTSSLSCSPFAYVSTTALPQQSPLSEKHENNNSSSINHNQINGCRDSNYNNGKDADENKENMTNDHRHVMKNKQLNNNVPHNSNASSFVLNEHPSTSKDDNDDDVNNFNSNDYKADIKALLLYIRRVLSAHQQMTDVLIDKRVATLESQWNAKWGTYQTNVVQLQGKLQSLQQQMRHALSELAISCNVASPGL